MLVRDVIGLSCMHSVRLDAGKIDMGFDIVHLVRTVPNTAIWIAAGSRE